MSALRQRLATALRTEFEKGAMRAIRGSSGDRALQPVRPRGAFALDRCLCRGRSATARARSANDWRHKECAANAFVSLTPAQCGRYRCPSLTDRIDDATTARGGLMARNYGRLVQQLRSERSALECEVARLTQAISALKATKDAAAGRQAGECSSGTPEDVRCRAPRRQPADEEILGCPPKKVRVAIQSPRNHSKQGLVKARHRRGRETIPVPIDQSDHTLVLRFPGTGQRRRPGCERMGYNEKTDPMSIANSSDILQAVIDATPDAIFVKDLDGRYMLVNDAAARFLGSFACGDCRQETTSSSTPRRTARQFIEDDRQVMATGLPQAFEGVATGSDGARQAYLVTKGVYRDADGRILGLFGISHDITELRPPNESLAQTRRRCSARRSWKRWGSHRRHRARLQQHPLGNPRERRTARVYRKAKHAATTRSRR